MPSKDEIIAELEKYNKELLSKLENASEWMQRSIEEKKRLIENDESSHIAIKERYDTFFGEHIIESINADVFDDILSSETLYYHLLHDSELDGTGIIIGYNKAVDITLEYVLTKPFRSFARKKSKNICQSHRPEERFLYEVIYEGYSISIGKLYGILKERESINKWFFTDLFFTFLKEYKYITDVLYKESFYKNLETLVSKEYFGSKRHRGSVSREEVQEVRSIVLGDFKNKDCILYQLFTM
jgi:hypothetical protein